MYVWAVGIGWCVNGKLKEKKKRRKRGLEIEGEVWLVKESKREILRKEERSKKLKNKIGEK